jgi:phosphate transport system substrate-binding protein
MLHVKENGSAPAIEPSEASVSSGEYSIARPLHLYTAGAPTGLTRAFIDYTLSPAGQNVVQETGYVKVN